MSTTECPLAPECKLATAYRDLEGHIMDCANMARITNQIASDEQGRTAKSCSPSARRCSCWKSWNSPTGQSSQRCRHEGGRQ